MFVYSRKYPLSAQHTLDAELGVVDSEANKQQFQLQGIAVLENEGEYYNATSMEGSLSGVLSGPCLMVFRPWCVPLPWCVGCT